MRFRKWLANMLRKITRTESQVHPITLADAIEIMRGGKPSLQMVEVEPDV
jgi:hypothetical protein